MTKFEVKTASGLKYEVEKSDDFNYYPYASIHVKREYIGEEEGGLTENKKLLDILKEGDKNNIITKKIRLFSRETREEYEAIDTYVVLKNMSLKEDVSEFSVAASNSYIDSIVQFKFLIEDSMFIFTKEVRMGQNYNLLCIIENLEDYLLEAVEDEEISNVSESSYEEYISIKLLDEVHQPLTIDIELSELLDGLVEVKFIKANHIIKN